MIRIFNNGFERDPALLAMIDINPLWRHTGHVVGRTDKVEECKQAEAIL